MRIVLATLAVVAVPIVATPSIGQSMPGMSMPGMAMPGMTMPATSKPPRAARKAAPSPHPAGHGARGAAASRPAAGHGAAQAAAAPMPAMPATMSGMTMAPGSPPMPGMTAVADTVPAGTALSAGDAPPPPVPTDHYADRRFDPAAMAVARARMMGEEGGGATMHQILFNLAELQVHDGRAGYRWDGEAWFGSDVSRVVLKSEGQGGGRDGLEAAEVQALYSRAIGPYFNAQAGIRHDIAPTPTRTYATIGVEGLAPYEVRTEAAVFLSTRGELIGRIEGWYDQRITQVVILQPRIELNLAAQDQRDIGIGAGLSGAELGLRLRYEIAREFAPYIGVSYDATTGRTADLARAAGRDVTATRFVAGVRFWF